jgi:hypothetical protein
LPDRFTAAKSRNSDSRSGRIVGRPRVERNIGRVVTLWEAAHGKDENGRNARGFAGQILFFGPGG